MGIARWASAALAVALLIAAAPLAARRAGAGGPCFIRSLPPFPATSKLTRASLTSATSVC